MEEIGRRLHQKRLEKKLSIEEVNLRTRIPIKFIGAMEEADYSKFSAEVYYTGSLRKYARFLGLDENELMELYRAHVTQARVLLSPPEKRNILERPVTKIALIILLTTLVIAAAGMVIITRLRYSRHVSENTGNRPVPADSPATVPLPEISTWTPASVYPIRKSTPAVVPGEVSSGTVTVPEVSKGLYSTDIPVKLARSVTAKGLALKIKTTQGTWLRITADNKRVFEGVIPAGFSRQWTTNDRYDIIIGYVPGVKMTLNGRPVNVRRGAVKDVNSITLTRENQQSI